MKKKGLKYRFSVNDKSIWMFWHRCMWCGMNRWDCLHHIISPSSRGHKLVPFNSSILNSSPMHNNSCHLENGQLHHREVEIKLLEKTMTALAYNDYKLMSSDKAFIQTYWETHYQHFKNLLK